MNKLLKLVCLTLLMAGIFGCASSTEEPLPTDTPATDGQKLLALRLLNGDDSPPPVDTPIIWGVKVGDVFDVTKKYDDTPGAETIEFDFTSLGIDDDLLVKIVAKFSWAPRFIEVTILPNGGTASWNLVDELANEIPRANVATDIYKQTFLQSENPSMDFTVIRDAAETLITVTDDEYEYVLTGSGGEIASVTVTEVNEL